MDTFCPTLMNCEDSIVVIAEIIAKNTQVKTVDIENKFKSLGLLKVKDLAGSSLKTVYRMDVGNDPIAEVYKAIESYEASYTEQLKLAKSEFDQENFIKTQEICCQMISSKPDDVTVLNLLAASYYKCGDYDKSLEYFNKVLDLCPTCGEALNNIGSIFWTISEYNEACRFYFLALKTKPNYLNGWINYASALFKANDFENADIVCNTILTQYPKLYKVRNMGASILLSLNNTKEAKKQYKIAKNDGPDFSDIWFNLGHVYLITNKIEKAILHFEKSSELNPNSITTWINLGIAYFKFEKYSFAIESFNKVLQLCPENVKAMENLATIYEHNLDDIPLAVKYYEKLLELQPSSFELNLKVGFLYFSKLEKRQESESYFKKCIELNPQIEDAYKYLIRLYELQDMKNCAAECYEQLGDLYLGENDIKNACYAYTHSVCLDPKNENGHSKLGVTLHKMGHFDLALLRYRKALELEPGFPDVYCNIALVYESMNLPQQAIKYYYTALTFQPDHKNALLNVCNLEFELGNFDIVAKFCEKIIEFDSSKAFDFHFKLADTFYKKLSNFNKAIYHYEKALKIDSTCSDVYLNVGNLLLDMKKSEKALCCFRRATELNPQCVMAYTNIGSINKDCENFTEAIHAYKTALNIEPDLPDAYCSLVQCLQHICDWSDYDLRIAKLKDIVHQQLDNNLVPSVSPYQSLFYPFSSEVLKKIALKNAEQFDENTLATNNPHYEYQTSLHHERIRVGYVCSDFGDNPTSHVIRSIASFHDQNKNEVFFYLLSPNNPSLSWSNFSSESVNLKDISDLHILDAANLINKDGIHVLVNVNGYKLGPRNEIFALRPAPIQVLWHGYSGTSGAPFFNYLIADETCLPSEFQRFYTEQLAYLNRTVFIGDHKTLFGNLKRVQNTETVNINTNLNTFIPINNGDMGFDESSKANLMDTIAPNMCSNNKVDDTSQFCSRQHYNIPEDAVVFCNFSQSHTLDPSTFNMWLTILKNVPNAVLWLLGSSADCEVNLRKYATESNIDSACLIFTNLEPQDKHMAIIRLADVFLDTPLCDDHTKCLDALWAGIPVVTLPKETFASRIAASQLTTLGFTLTIAQNEKHYIGIATQLGTNKETLETQKKLLWSLKSSSKLFNCQSYAKELETVYRDLWTKFLCDT